MAVLVTVLVVGVEGLLEAFSVVACVVLRPTCVDVLEVFAGAEVVELDVLLEVFCELLDGVLLDVFCVAFLLVVFSVEVVLEAF